MSTFVTQTHTHTQTLTRKNIWVTIFPELAPGALPNIIRRQVLRGDDFRFVVLWSRTRTDATK